MRWRLIYISFKQKHLPEECFLDIPHFNEDDIKEVITEWLKVSCNIQLSLMRLNKCVSLYNSYKVWIDLYHDKMVILAGRFDSFQLTSWISLWLLYLGTVECRYNALQYSTIMHQSLQWPRQNFNQDLHSHKTPLRGKLWGVHCEYIGENCSLYNDTALYFILSTEFRSHPPGSTTRPLGDCMYSLCIAIVCKAFLWFCHKVAQLPTRRGMHSWTGSGGLDWTIIWKGREIPWRSFGPPSFGIFDSS